MTENIKAFSGRLKSLKGWLTQTITACNNLIEMPRSIANDSFLKSRIQNAIQESKSIKNIITFLIYEDTWKPYILSGFK